MLQVDPMKRATMEDIKAHDWFKRELPAYLFPPPNETDASIVDIDAVQVSIGISKVAAPRFLPCRSFPVFNRLKQISCLRIVYKKFVTSAN